MFTSEAVADFLIRLLQLDLLLFLEWGAWLALSAWWSGSRARAERGAESIEVGDGLIEQAGSRGSRLDARAA